jgi:hypothetical protein
MNRRGFLRAVSATGLALLWPGLAAAKAAPKKSADEILREAIMARRVIEFSYLGFCAPRGAARARPGEGKPPRPAGLAGVRW